MNIKSNKSKNINRIIGAVILDYHSFEKVNNTIQMLKDTGIFSYYVIVDNTVDFNKEKYIRNSKIHVILNDKNLGYGPAINIGIDYLINNCNVDYILSINYDMKISREDITRCLNVIDNSHPLSTCIMRNPDETIDQSFWPIMKYSDYRKLLTIKGSTSIINKRKELALNAVKTNDEIVECESLHESLMLIDAKYIKKYGNLFDNGIFMYCEGDAIALNLKKNNKKAFCVLNASCYHYHDYSNRKLSFNRNFYKSAYYILKKYYKINRVKLLFFTIFYYVSIFERLIIFCLVKIKHFFAHK